MWKGFTLAGVPLAATDRGYRLDPAATGPIAGGLSDGSPVMCLTHFPVRSLEQAFRASSFAYAGDLAEREAIERDLEIRTGPTVVLAGHLHGRHAGAGGRLLQVSCGPLIEAPFEITFVTIHRTGDAMAVDVRCEAVAPSGSLRLPVLSSATGRWDWDGAAWVQTG
jgi:hypothetical protein